MVPAHASKETVAHARHPDDVASDRNASSTVPGALPVVSDTLGPLVTYSRSAGYSDMKLQPTTWPRVQSNAGTTPRRVTNHVTANTHEVLTHLSQNNNRFRTCPRLPVEFAGLAGSSSRCSEQRRKSQQHQYGTWRQCESSNATEHACMHRFCAGCGFSASIV